MMKRRHAAHIVGSIDGIDDEGSIQGWAMDQNAPAEILDLTILADERQIGSGRADQFRPDLLAAGFGDGKHGFKVPVTDLSRPLLSLSIIASTVGRTRESATLPLDADSNIRMVRALMKGRRLAGLPDPVGDVFRQVSAGAFDGTSRDPAPHEKIYLADELFVGALLAHAAPGASGSSPA